MVHPQIAHLIIMKKIGSPDHFGFSALLLNAGLWASINCSLFSNDICWNYPPKSISSSPSVYIFPSPQRSHRGNPWWPLKVQSLNCDPIAGQSKIKIYVFDKWTKSHCHTESCGLMLWSWMASITQLPESFCLHHPGHLPVTSLKLDQIFSFPPCFT